jgi:cell division protein FtsW (lipid II flippase)
MKPFERIAQRPRTVGTVAAAGATALGLAYLAAAGAPWHYLAINAAALLIGLVLLKLVGLLTPTMLRLPHATTLLISAALLATALLGSPVEGVTRWVKLGGISIQPGFVLLPILTIGFAWSRSAATAAAVLLAAAALAIQPDRAMAGALAAALGAVALMRPDRVTVVAFAGSLIAFAATLLQADTLAPTPFVEQVFTSAFDVHRLAGVAVVAGAILLLLPSAVGWRRDPSNREVYAVFGMFWLATICAALLGNYPTPLVGYGGSAIIGYVLSLALLPRLAGSCIWGEEPSHNTANNRPTDRHSRVENPAPRLA